MSNGNLDVSGTIVGASTLSATTGTFSGILKTDDTTAATSQQLMVHYKPTVVYQLL